MRLNLKTAVDCDNSETDSIGRRVAREKGANGVNGKDYFPEGKTNIPGMAPHDWWILGLLLRGQSLPQIAAITGISHPQLLTRTKRSVFQEQLTLQSQTIVENITNGNYGVSAIAKANAPDAMRRVVELFGQRSDPRVALQASEKCLNYAGFQPIKKVEVFSITSFFGKMDSKELMEYAEKGTLPDRFQDQAAQHRLLDPPKTEERKCEEAKRIDPDDDLPLADCDE